MQKTLQGSVHMKDVTSTSYKESFEKAGGCVCVCVCV
jgi:hypothetical protein